MTFRISMIEKARSEIEWRQARSARHRGTKKSWNISASKTFYNRFFRSTFRPCIRNQFITNIKLRLSVLCLLVKPLEKAIARCGSFPDEPWSFWPADKTAFWILALICTLSFLSNLKATAIADYIKITSKIEYNFVTCKMQKYIFFFYLLLKESTDFFLHSREECLFVRPVSGLTVLYSIVSFPCNARVKFIVLFTWSERRKELIDCRLPNLVRARVEAFLASKLPTLLSSNVVAGTSILARTNSGLLMRIRTMSEGFGLCDGSWLQHLRSNDALK